ncbi:MAG: hypothetical protein JWO31_241, partial [Phycisphaerales bacterium]|nr:hypothetical protein [Phycisphaerales bacterium]
MIASDRSSSSSSLPPSSLPSSTPSSAESGGAGSSRREAKPAGVSDRKRAANRANAARSTGPRTAAGKRRASLNAVRHGLWAEASILPGEPAAELAALATEFELDYGGGGAVERALAARVVAVAWKLRRLARAEETMAFDHLVRAERARNRLADPDAGLAGAGDFDPPRGARMLADDFVAGGAPGRMQQLLAAEVRLTGQMASLCRLLLRAREKGGTGAGSGGGGLPLPGGPLGLDDLFAPDGFPAADDGAGDDDGGG